MRRHGGVLGLAACVRAFPHSIPESIPDILVALSKHVHDPPVIVVSCFLPPCFIGNSNNVKCVIAEYCKEDRGRLQAHSQRYMGITQETIY